MPCPAPPTATPRAAEGSGQEVLPVGELPGEVLVDHEVEAPLGEGLLLGANPHLQQLLERLLPRLVRLEEGVVLQRVLRALHVHLLELVRRVLEVEVDDVLWRHAQEACLGNAEEAVDVGRVPRADLQRPIDVRDAVGVAVHEAVDRQLLVVGQAPDEASGCSRRDAAHGDEDAVRVPPPLVVVETGEHAAGLDGEDELRGGAGDDNLYGGTESDTLEGGSGDDRLEAGAGNDSLMGGIGEDTLMGDAGVDFIMGGAGSDKLTGGSGADVFAWGKADYGNSTNPYQDEITDFSATDGDVIDLSDLLVDEENGNLSDYIRISTGNLDGNGATETEISIDHDGGNFHQPTNKIQLTDVDLSEGGTLSEQEMLNKLLNDGNLDVDT